MSKAPVVAIGLLTEHDLKVLGQGFDRHIPVPDDDLFADLLAALDKFEIEPLGRGIVLLPSQAGLPPR